MLRRIWSGQIARSGPGQGRAGARGSRQALMTILYLLRRDRRGLTRWHSRERRAAPSELRLALAPDPLGIHATGWCKPPAHVQPRARASRIDGRAAILWSSCLTFSATAKIGGPLENLRAEDGSPLLVCAYDEGQRRLRRDQVGPGMRFAYDSSLYAETSGRIRDVVANGEGAP